MHVPNLRSPHIKTGGIVYFARMLDKIRLHAEGTLPKEYQMNLGIHFDDRCCQFLKINYADLVQRVKQGGTDEEILEWCFTKGEKPTDEQIEVWSEFMRKRGWNDAGAEILKKRLAENDASDRTDIQTMFDYIDFDEGRIP